MSRKEFEILKSILDDIDVSDDKIDALERLHHEVKKIINEYIKQKIKVSVQM